MTKLFRYILHGPLLLARPEGKFLNLDADGGRWVGRHKKVACLITFAGSLKSFNSDGNLIK